MFDACSCGGAAFNLGVPLMNVHDTFYHYHRLDGKEGGEDTRFSTCLQGFTSLRSRGTHLNSGLPAQDVCDSEPPTKHA